MSDPQFTIRGFLAVGDETPAVGEYTPLADAVPDTGAGVVVAVSNMALRRRIIDDYVLRHGLSAPNIVHPDARIDPRGIIGQGNIIGPSSYFGAATTLDSFNVVHYHCTVGHHSRIGINNFFSPNFHCGNSIVVRDDSFFGLGCTVAPHVVVGRGGTFQAGICLFDDTESDTSYFSPNRLKSVKSLEGTK